MSSKNRSETKKDAFASKDHWSCLHYVEKYTYDHSNQAYRECPFQNHLQQLSEQGLDRNLRVMKLSNCSLPVSSITLLSSCLSSSFPVLNLLFLGGNKFGDSGVSILYNAIHSRIKHNENSIQLIDLSNNGISNAGARFIAKMIYRSYGYITVVFKNNPISGEGLSFIFSAKHWESFEIKNSSISTDLPLFLTSLLEHSVLLKELSIEGNGLFSKAFQEISTSIQEYHFPCLKRLKINEVLRDEGLMLLLNEKTASALRNVHWIAFQNGEISKKGHQYLIDMIKEDNCLPFIDRIEISDDGCYCCNIVIKKENQFRYINKIEFSCLNSVNYTSILTIYLMYHPLEVIDFYGNSKTFLLTLINTVSRLGYLNNLKQLILKHVTTTLSVTEFFGSAPFPKLEEIFIDHMNLTSFAYSDSLFEKYMAVLHAQRESEAITNLPVFGPRRRATGSLGMATLVSPRHVSLASPLNRKPSVTCALISPHDLHRAASLSTAGVFGDSELPPLTVGSNTNRIPVQSGLSNSDITDAYLPLPLRKTPAIPESHLLEEGSPLPIVHPMRSASLVSRPRSSYMRRDNLSIERILKSESISQEVGVEEGESDSSDEFRIQYETIEVDGERKDDQKGDRDKPKALSCRVEHANSVLLKDTKSERCDCILRKLTVINSNISNFVVPLFVVPYFATLQELVIREVTISDVGINYLNRFYHTLHYHNPIKISIDAALSIESKQLINMMSMFLVEEGNDSNNSDCGEDATACATYNSDDDEISVTISSVMYDYKAIDEQATGSFDTLDADVVTLPVPASAPAPASESVIKELPIITDERRGCCTVY